MKLHQSCSKTAGLCEAFPVCGGQYLTNVVQGRIRLTDACAERRLACLIRSYRRATVALIAVKVTAGDGKKFSDNFVN